MERGQCTSGSRIAWVLCGALLAADAVFIALHCWHWPPLDAEPGLGNPLFHLAHERGYAEIYQYLKWLAIIVLLVNLAFETDDRRYLAFVLLFAYFLCDDAAQVHERLGRAVAPYLDSAPPWGLRPQDVAEVLVSGAFGLLFMPLFAVAYLTGLPRLRRDFIALGALTLALVAFGVAGDFLHALVRGSGALDRLLGIVEDGGELVAASAIVGFVVHLNRRALLTHSGRGPSA